MQEMKSFLKEYLSKRHEIINSDNRSRLVNRNLTLICSNCMGGILYHWLGMRFNSPFINCYLTNNDYVLMLEHWKDFLNADLVEDDSGDESYPVGKGYLGIRIHFLHYTTFAEAIEKWNERKTRIDMHKTVFMFTDYADSRGGYSLLERFDRLPFKYKVVFTGEKYPKLQSAVHLKGYKNFSGIFRKLVRQVPNIWMTQNYITGKRFIDQFDYVSWFNTVSEEEKDG